MANISIIPDLMVYAHIKLLTSIPISASSVCLISNLRSGWDMF